MYPSILQPSDDSAHFSVCAKHTHLMRVPISPSADMLTNGMKVLHPITVKTPVLQRRYLSSNSSIKIFRSFVTLRIVFLLNRVQPVFSNYALYDVSFPQASISKNNSVSLNQLAASQKPENAFSERWASAHLSHLMRLWNFSSSVNSFFKHACAAIQWG